MKDHICVGVTETRHIVYHSAVRAFVKPVTVKSRKTLDGYDRDVSVTNMG